MPLDLIVPLAVGVAVFMIIAAHDLQANRRSRRAEKLVRTRADVMPPLTHS